MSQTTPGTNTAPAYKFAPHGRFYAELRARVDAYFAQTRRKARGGLWMYLDAAIVAVWLLTSYALLVFVASAWWQAALLCVSLACAVAAVGFKIQHDGNHGAFSSRRWVNSAMSYALDAIGASSYIWRYKHNVLHHSYTNLDGADADINLGFLGRLSPAQRRLWFHRFQHIYLWPLYSALVIKWQLVDDFVELVAGRIGRQRFPRPRGWALWGVFGGKALFAVIAFGVPLLVRPAWLVVIGYAATMLATGFLIAVVFQLAHTVTEADHPVLAGDARLANEWAVHQVRTTADFARYNPVVTWCLGGLNHQVSHHLFPRVAHVHYPAISRIVEEVSAEHGVQYVAHRSVFSAVASHARFLRAMGRKDRAA